MKKIPLEEITRKIVHLSSIFYPLAYLMLFNKNTMLMITGCLLISIVLIDILRNTNLKFNHFFYKIVGFALREKERSGITGSTYFMTGTFVTILFFPKEYAVLSLVVLIISDTFASICGIIFGRTKIVSGKSLEGSIAFFLSALAISCIGSIYFEISLIKLILASLFATIFELYSNKIKCDDNILIPLSYGLILFL